MQAVKLACERPDACGRSLSHWDCAEIARQLVAEAVVPSISTETVRRLLERQHLKPWRYHLWLSPKVPRDAHFLAQVQEVIDLYTRPLAEHEVVLSVDEKTNLQPRPRTSATRAATPKQPMRVEQEYQRVGAVNLLAAFNTRTGQVTGVTASRKRQAEFIELLELLEAQTPSTVTTIHVVMDNVRMHTGKQVQAWLAEHPRFVCHFTPVHCSWLNQIEQWFSILQRKRLRVVDFASLAQLGTRLHQFIEQWNARAHPFQWTTQSAAKVRAKCGLSSAA